MILAKQLRYYQREAVDALFEHDYLTNPLMSMATGTGKAIVLCAFCKEALERVADTNIIVAVTSMELAMQNYEEMLGLWPEAPASVYSAGAGKKDLSGRIIFCTIQSMWRKAFQLHKTIDALLIDEVQDVSDENGTMYRKFIDDLKIASPNLIIAGLSATIFRLSQGLLTDGKNALFGKVIYEYGMLQGIKDGYLSPLISKSMNQGFDLTGVGVQGGDYILSKLEKAVDKDPITKAIVDELMEYGKERKCWLVFATGIDHASHIRDEIRSRGISCESVSSKTPKEERKILFSDYKSGKIRCVVNVNIMSKGSNIPQIDLIAACRPSKSAGFVVQAAGRGTRLYPGKSDCLILDYANWLSEHGPIDLIKPKRKGEKGEGVAPTKTCPECKTIVFAGCVTCPTCDYIFPEPELKIETEASTAAALSTQLKIESYAVTGVSYYRHTKEGKKDTLRVEYQCGLTKSFRDWWFIEQSGSMRSLACLNWHKGAGTKTPNTVTEALGRIKELRQPKTVQVRKEGKYFKVQGVEM